MQTRPCYLHPLKSHFYEVKRGFTGVYYFSYFFSKNRLWVLVRTALRALKHRLCVLVRTASLTEAVLTSTHTLCLQPIYKHQLEPHKCFNVYCSRGIIKCVRLLNVNPIYKASSILYHFLNTVFAPI